MAVTLGTPALDMLDMVLDQLDGLGSLDPVARALAVSEIRLQLDAALTRVRDEAVAHALLLPVEGARGPRRLRMAELAAELGLTRGTVANMASSYRAWLAR